MSARYTSGGKRRSSQTHSRHGHPCDLCAAVPFGNGGAVAHGRAHVRRGEAVELLSPNGVRAFVAPSDAETLGRMASWTMVGG